MGTCCTFPIKNLTGNLDPSGLATSQFRFSKNMLDPAASCVCRLTDTYSVTVRDCTVDNGDTTSDTEMGRESHCWMVNMVRFNDVDMYGCALACHTDGCNRAPAHRCRQVSLAALVVAMATSATLVALAHTDGK